MMNRCGIDIVELDRIAGLKDKELWKKRIFSDRELALAEERGGRDSFFAGRWAAKEAVAKALGCGFGKFCSPNEIEVLSDEFHAPVLMLNGNAAETAQKLGVVTWCVSVSHEKHYAVAVAIAEIEDKK
ncbi:MAG: holo-ACP synthase [Lentisphaeria bacterium]|nr:holo-ACP synthase [Lentisphaeria bacterium]